MSASAKRNVRFTFNGGPEKPVAIKAIHHLKPFEDIERCSECNKRLAPGQHELCPRCDAMAFDRMPLTTKAYA